MMTVMDFTREQVKAAAQSGLMNIKSLLHFDVCKALSEGKAPEFVAEEQRISVEEVRYIRRRKCPRC